ncbi:HAD hydrolase family protein [Bifidobacterium sp. ESL0798]|uniref:HAD family hydrolase n=1 Tax=Bifidobacterium sp. ESL0798 TaxID=2983235 RepID=UPI0023F97B01|nr:HAD hydrolase family protein [Bifidobacterium sp. ESL0798]WEV74779.1 HAD hydrolase family protein [Bifidobacterium sp. ESL0798]
MLVYETHFFIAGFMIFRNSSHQGTDVTDVDLSTGGKLLVVDLDLTVLCGDEYGERWLSQRSEKAFATARQVGNVVMVATARPPMTAFDLVHRLGSSACAYHNGGVVDLDCEHSSLQELGDDQNTENGNIVRFGVSVERCVEVCRQILARIPNLRMGIELNDTRYTNFDLTDVWPSQEYRLTDFNDMPEGMAQKIMMFPTDEQRESVRSLVPDDMALLISEDALWLLMNPRATKRNAMDLACRHFGIPVSDTVAFGDDLIDMDLLEYAGCGVAVANAKPEVKDIASDRCPSNNEDGVAQWIGNHL